MVTSWGYIAREEEDTVRRRKRKAFLILPLGLVYDSVGRMENSRATIYPPQLSPLLASSRLSRLYSTDKRWWAP